MHECHDCGNDPRGLMAIIPQEAWLRISPTGTLDGYLCPWCMSKRLSAIGLQTTCELHLCLPYLSAVNVEALRQAELIEIERARRSNS